MCWLRIEGYLAFPDGTDIETVLDEFDQSEVEYIARMELKKSEQTVSFTCRSLTNYFARTDAIEFLTKLADRHDALAGRVEWSIPDWQSDGVLYLGRDQLKLCLADLRTEIAHLQRREAELVARIEEEK